MTQDSLDTWFAAWKRLRDRGSLLNARMQLENAILADYRRIVLEDRLDSQYTINTAKLRDEIQQEEKSRDVALIHCICEIVS